MQYWFLGVSFMVGCALLSGPKFMELGMIENPDQKVMSSSRSRSEPESGTRHEEMGRPRTQSPRPAAPAPQAQRPAPAPQGREDPIK